MGLSFVLIRNTNVDVAEHTPDVVCKIVYVPTLELVGEIAPLKLSKLSPDGLAVKEPPIKFTVGVTVPIVETQ